MHSSSSRTENLAELSRLWNEIQDTKQKLENDIQFLAQPGSPTAASSPKQSQEQEKKLTTAEKPSSPCQNSTNGLDAIITQLPRRSFSFGKRAYGAAAEPPKFGEGRNQERMKTGDRAGGDSADLDSTNSPENVRPRRTVKSKGKLMRQRRQGNNGTVSAVVSNSQSQALIPLALGRRRSQSDDEIDLNRCDISLIDEILQDTDLHELDLDEILSEISDHVPDVSVSEVQDFFQQVNSLQRGSDAAPETYKHLYYEERYRRDHCENEISKLQKELLEVSEQAAVFDGMLRGKDATIHKMTKVCDRLQGQLSSKGKAVEEKINEVQKENAELKSKLAESKDKASLYQQELDKALQQGSDLKVKVQGIVKELEAEKKLGKEQKERLLAQVSALEVSLGSAQAEKESSFRALRDCQDSLDTTKNFFNTVSDELQMLKAEYKLLGEKSKDQESENEKLKSELLLLDTENSEMASRIVSIEDEMSQIKSEKVILESDFRRKLADEREKLHEYYNAKIKEVLDKESQKMIEAENEFVSLHEVKLKRVESEASDRLEQMRTKFSSQLQQMKTKFETQLNLLKKENEEKSELIGTVSEQLQHFSQRDRGDEIGRVKPLLPRARSQDADLESLLVVTGMAERNVRNGGVGRTFGNGEF